MTLEERTLSIEMQLSFTLNGLYLWHNFHVEWIEISIYAE